VSYTPLNHQSAWTTDSIAAHAGLASYGGSLPHLRPNAPTQTFTTLPATAVPRPPATVRNRPLSAGARNRQLRDRPAPDTVLPPEQYGENTVAVLL